MFSRIMFFKVLAFEYVLQSFSRMHISARRPEEQSRKLKTVKNIIRRTCYSYYIMPGLQIFKNIYIYIIYIIYILYILYIYYLYIYI